MSGSYHLTKKALYTRMCNSVVGLAESAG
jgi:hypothetical protein